MKNLRFKPSYLALVGAVLLAGGEAGAEVNACHLSCGDSNDGIVNQFSPPFSQANNVPVTITGGGCVQPLPTSPPSYNSKLDKLCDISSIGDCLALGTVTVDPNSTGSDWTLTKNMCERNKKLKPKGKHYDPPPLF